jgi:hypothetical protein
MEFDKNIAKIQKGLVDTTIHSMGLMTELAEYL